MTTPPSRIYPYLYIYGLTGIEALFLFRNICLQEKLKFRAGEAWYGFGRELLYTDNLNNGWECLGFIAIDPNAPCTTTFAHPYRSTVSCEKQRSRHSRDLNDLIWRRPPPLFHINSCLHPSVSQVDAPAVKPSLKYIPLSVASVATR